MTGNRTTELLRERLTEHGIEWRSGLKGVTLVGDWCFVEYENGKLAATCEPVLTPEQAIAATLGSEINGDTSDGYHTFNELYHHRAVLFSVIVRDHRELAWKARKHHDGTMYDGMFIVGIETPKGQATYHYDLDPYWEMFDCEEREFAPEWDGHTPDDAIARSAELGSGTCENANTDGYCFRFECSECGYSAIVHNCAARLDELQNFCPNCGKRVSA